ncbi:MAG: ECF transporter S component [Acholeplasmatales bacterium]|nr:ECF transporter S component [Acholeplasmatales bacterium]
MDNKIKKMILTSIFAAMSVLLYLFPKFSLPFFPSFLEMNFSMLPIIICGFACGSIYGGLCVLLRYLSNLIIEGSITAGVGEVMDLMLGGLTVIAGAFLYNNLKLKEPKKSIISLVVCLFVWVLSGVLLNIFYAIPLYLKLYFGDNVNALVGALHIIPGVNSSNYLFKYTLYAVIPFNLLLGSVVLIVTFFVNKLIYMLYDNEKVSDKDLEDDEIETVAEDNTTTNLEEENSTI